VSRAAAEVGSTANSYQILAKLAAGGMAEIFLARGEGVAGVERYCVLKRILRDRATDVHFVRMFLDEARLAAQLQHPNIAQVYDIGKLGDSYFFTMEYVHGETVRALLHRAQGLRRALPIHGVLTIAAGTAAGLHHAHDRLGLDGRALGIVHRDVSPSNLMVSYEGGVKVVDFGVAKAADRAQETKSGTVKGKISYLSPEQCRGKRVDRRSDLFSLGICFWEMLTTERLYKRATDFENMNAIVTEPTPAPSSRRADVPKEIDALVLRLLAKNPDDRFQTAAEVVEAIEAVSARTSMVLSASALGRFVRELFGQRPEPWLELDAARDQPEPVTVTSEPIPRELGLAVADAVDQRLASVIDLSTPPSVTESIDALHSASSVPLGLGLAKVDKLAALGLPLAAPPPTNPGIEARAIRSTPPLGARSETVSLSMVPAEPVAVDKVPPPLGPLPKTPVPPLGALPKTPVPPLAPSGATPAPSGSFSAAASAHPAASLGMASRRRAWPLYAVIGGAALIGSFAMALAMRSASVEHVAEGSTAVPAAAVPARTAISVVPIVEPPAAAPVHVEPPAPVVAKPAARGSRGVEPVARAAARTVEPARPAAAPEDEITRAFAAQKFDQVVVQCSGGPVSAEHAPLCFIAACHVGDEARARRLISAVPVARRAPLVASCQELGVDVAVAGKKPVAKPVDDCEADPMACQH